MLQRRQQAGAHLEVRTPSATACMLSTMADNFSPLPILRPTVRLRLRSPAVFRHVQFDCSSRTPLPDIEPQAPVLQPVCGVARDEPLAADTEFSCSGTGLLRQAHLAATNLAFAASDLGPPARTHLSQANKRYRVFCCASAVMT